ncbi:MAG: hypothetical protein ACRDRO_08445 [Pseudonocardiaceae bacterium]
MLVPPRRAPAAVKAELAKLSYLRGLDAQAPQVLGDGGISWVALVQVQLSIGPSSSEPCGRALDQRALYCSLVTCSPTGPRVARRRGRLR